MKLLQYGQPIPTIFDLLGTKENHMTAGLAFVLASSPKFLAGTISSFAPRAPSNVEDAIVRIQTVRCDEGITDIEIECGKELFAVIEAKRGPMVPSRQQMECYAPVVKKQKARSQFLVTISNASQEFAAQHQPTVIAGIPLVHLSWRAVRQVAMKAITGETNANKQLLNHFTAYLGELLGMENKFSNRVYVVSLSGDNPGGWNLSFIDVVEKRDRYFYPVKKGWPDPPPNYLGFRYKGKLQSIRRVKSFIINTNPHEVFPEAPDAEWKPHYVLTLGPPIVPPHTVKNGPKIFQANRCWCMIDALLTSPTISDAMTETKRREAQDS